MNISNQRNRSMDNINSNIDERIPVKNDEVERVIKEINSKEQFYSIALFDILGFSKFVEKNGYDNIMKLYNVLVELIHKHESSPEGEVSFAGSVVPVPISYDCKENVFIADANGYVQVCHFSDTFLLFVNYELSAPGGWLRSGYYEPYPLLVKEQGSMFFAPFDQNHRIYLSFLQTCMDFFCQSVMNGIPLRGVISSGLARMDPANSIFFGQPLVEAGKGEPAQSSLGVAFGKSFNNYHPIYNRYFIPYSNHIKKCASGADYLSHMVLDWARHWRENYSNVDFEVALNKMDTDPKFSDYYKNTLSFYEFSSNNSEWAKDLNCEGLSDIRDYYVRTEKWLKEKMVKL